MKNTAMKSLVLLTILALCATVAAANCGHKTTQEGTVKSVDAESSTVVVTVGDEEVQLTMTANTQVMDADGNAVEAASLVGKSVKVVSEHAKIDSIQQTA